MLLLPSFDSCRDRWCERERERNKVGQKQHENKDFSVEEKRMTKMKHHHPYTESEIIMSCEICLASLLLCSVSLFFLLVFPLKLIDHQSDPLLFYRLRCYKNVLLLLYHTLDSLAVFDTNPMMVAASSFILGCLSRSPFSSHIFFRVSFTRIT